jgi:hypothetical protein
MTDHFGRCKMCKGWRPNADTWFTLYNVLQHEVPAALRPTSFTLPMTVFDGLRTQGAPLLYLFDGRAGLRDIRIHRDDIPTFVRKVENELRTWARRRATFPPTA